MARQDFYKPKGSETVTLTTSIATLKSLMSAGKFHPGVTRLRIQNLEADDMYIAVSLGGAPANTGAMAILPQNQVWPFEYEMHGCDCIYVAGGSVAHHAHVFQDGV